LSPSYFSSADFSGFHPFGSYPSYDDTPKSVDPLSFFLLCTLYCVRGLFSRSFGGMFLWTPNNSQNSRLFSHSSLQAHSPLPSLFASFTVHGTFLDRPPAPLSRVPAPGLVSLKVHPKKVRLVITSRPQQQSFTLSLFCFFPLVHKALGNRTLPKTATARPPFSLLHPRHLTVPHSFHDRQAIASPKYPRPLLGFVSTLQSFPGSASPNQRRI